MGTSLDANFGDGLDDGDDLSEAHEINVTPFIDVILVLLIIFMVAAPLSTVDLPVNLPSSTATPQKRPDKPTFVTIKADLSTAVGENAVARSGIVGALDTVPELTKESPIFIRADRGVPYGELMDVMELLRKGGYRAVRLVALEGPGNNAAGAAPAPSSAPASDKP